MAKFMMVSLIAVVVATVIWRPPQILNPAESVFLFFRAQIMRFVRPKYFHNDRTDFKPIAFEQVLKNTTHDIDEQGTVWTLTTHYQGEHRPTTIHLLSEFDPKKPTLIYHHGAGDTNPMKDFTIVFGKKYIDAYNTFIIHASYHQSKKDYLHHSVDSFLHHQLTFVGSVLAVDEIVKYHRHHSDQKVISTGVSMGGIVSSLHAFYFGTADRYFPIVAYPNVGEIFIGDAYKTVTLDWEAKRQIDAYPQSFAINEFDLGLKTKVFPILGEYDRIVPFKWAFEFWQNKGFEVKVFPYGHLMPGFVPDKIREYIEAKTT